MPALRQHRSLLHELDQRVVAQDRTGAISQRRVGGAAPAGSGVVHAPPPPRSHEGGPLVAARSGTVVAETFIGGKSKNRQVAKAVTIESGKRTAANVYHTAVLALISKEAGEVRSSVVADVTTATLR